MTTPYRSALIGPWRTIRAVLRSMDAAGDLDDLGLLGRSVQLMPPFLVGVLVGGFAGPKLFLESAYRDAAFALLGGVLAFGALIVGFVANLMLFTGKLERSAGIALELAQAYAARLRELLHSQAVTLITALLMCLLCVSCFVAIAFKLPALSMIVLGGSTFGYVSLCFFRSILLPVQMFELHDAWLKDAIEGMASEVTEKYRKQSAVEKV